MHIDDWRERIDAVDLKILELLNERARFSLEIGKIKHRQNLPIYVPEREHAIYARMEHANKGPLTGAAVRRLNLSTIGFLQYVGPTLQFLVAILVFREPLDSAKLVSFGLIWLAIAVYVADSLLTHTAQPLADRPE